jgi:O-acetyl-ADP-ribose deacetylase (regulator of RNase III)
LKIKNFINFQEMFMADTRNGVDNRIHLYLADITDLDIECFVYYARADLKLGSGFGGAIAIRGGPSIQQELDDLAPIKPGEAVITNAGDLKANFIIHANGPKFQEEDTEEKLKITINNVLKLADSSGIKAIALPPMGAGFYGVPLKVSAEICLDTAKKYLQNSSGINEIVFCLLDNREYRAFEQAMKDRA